ncbi:DNA-directed RNA polymerase I subunit RPA34 [Polymixia lowei]
MPRDISSSSSEDEADESVASSSSKQKINDKNTRYKCPADFVSFCHKPCRSTLADSLNNDNTELWVIKAPANFNPECFSGVTVPLSGLRTLRVPAAMGGATSGCGQQIYSVLASAHGTSELRLLTSPGQSSDDVVFGPAFSGLVNVCESYGDSGANQAPQAIPAAPAPSIPPGLKQRFQPFGSKTPTLTCVAESEADGAAAGPSSTTLRPRVVKHFLEEEGEERRRKKRREKIIKTEGVEVEETRAEEVFRVKHEPEAEAPSQEDVSGEKRKRKKKKKEKEREREREETQEELAADHTVKEEEITVKCEPVDIYYDNVESSAKKKKKKKKKKTDED